MDSSIPISGCVATGVSKPHPTITEKQTKPCFNSHHVELKTVNSKEQTNDSFDLLRVDSPAQALKPTTTHLKEHKIHPLNAAGASTGKRVSPEEAASIIRETIRGYYIVDDILEDKEDKEDKEKKDKMEIFIDFILFQEGLVKDRRFITEDSPEKYITDSDIEQVRLDQIISTLKLTLEEKAYFDLSKNLSQYLTTEKKVPNDVVNKKLPYLMSYSITYSYLSLLKAIFPFFENLLSGRGRFSEFIAFFEFATKYRQQIIDSGPDSYWLGRTNIITTALRTNEVMRRDFNTTVMSEFFQNHCTDVFNSMFDCNKHSGTPLKLKFGEELEYCIEKTEDDKWLVEIFARKLLNKKARIIDTNDSDEDEDHYGFCDNFSVYPFYDANRWFEINCTPYKMSSKKAYNCLKKTIEVVDEMRHEGLITYSSGHKHVDVQSATKGSTAVLFRISQEVERNPWLLRAFGNKKAIMEDKESFWYKTFADYADDTKAHAIKRSNKMIDIFNETAPHAPHPANKKTESDEETQEKLKFFALFYSQFIQMIKMEPARVFDDPNNHGEKNRAMGLLHIPGTETVRALSTLEFRFFRCPETVREIRLINQFLTAWFTHIHKEQGEGTPLPHIPDDIKSCQDYTDEEVAHEATAYLKKLGLNPEDYRCFFDKEGLLKPEEKSTSISERCTIL